MDAKPPPAPPGLAGKSGSSSDQSSDPNIVDKRQLFAPKALPNSEHSAEVNAFIDGKIVMVRRDTRMTDSEKEIAIAALEARRQAL